MFWKAWKTKTGTKQLKLDTLSHDIKGNKILAYHNNRDIRPLVVFYSGEDVYFLNSRTVKEYGKQYEGEVKIKFRNSNNFSYINTSSIQVMEKEEFFKIYKNKQFDTLYQLDVDDARNIINELNNRLVSDYLTIQRITINENYKSENEVLYSTEAAEKVIFNKIDDELSSDQINDANATILHLKNLIRYLNDINDIELNNYRNSIDLEEYMYNNCPNYQSKSDFLSTFKEMQENEKTELNARKKTKLHF